MKLPNEDLAGVCQLAAYSPNPCHGQLVRVHIVPRQLLKREKLDDLIFDSRTWVWGCGGIMGNGGHHGELDHSRRLKIPRSAIPADTEQLMAEVGLGWWLDREYGRSAA